MDPKIQLHHLPLTALRTPPYNPRQLTPTQRQHLRTSLEHFGLVDPLIVNQRNHHVVGGNQRLAVARELGFSHAPVVLLDLTDEQERELNIRLNANTGQWDMEKLVAEFNLPDLTRFGLDESLLVDLQDILAKNQAFAEEGEKELPEPLGEAITRPGDLIELGPHRLLCGDGADWDQVQRLLGGQPVHLVNTDPPYNVRVEPRSQRAIAAGTGPGASPAATFHHQQFDAKRRSPKSGVCATAKESSPKAMRPKDRPLANDFMAGEAFDQLLRCWFTNMAKALHPGGVFYAYGGYANCANYPPALEAAGLYFSQAIIWVKGHPVLTRKDFLGNHEWCFYGWKPGAAHKYFGPENITDVWEVKKVAPQNMVHLTEKPVELALRALGYSSLPGQRVLDLFGGSGSTLIAAQRLERSACLMEIDSHYCDVIVKRWEEETGRSAKRPNPAKAANNRKGTR